MGLFKQRSRIAKHRAQIERTLHRRAAALAAEPGVTGQPAPFDDHDLVRRVMAAYRRTTGAQEPLGNSMWRRFFETYHKAIHDTLLGDDVEAAARIFRNPADNNLFYGFDNLMADYAPYFADAGVRKANAMSALDGLARFAEAVGAIPLDNPELYGSKVIALTADGVISALERTLAWTVYLPNPFPGEHGVVTPRGVMSYRVPQALFQALRMKALLRDVERPQVVEIGGGLGRTAYYAHLLGLTGYTLVDVPLTLAAQAYYLGRCLAPDLVVLEGETAKHADAIRLVSPETFHAGAERYDLALNADSSSELDIEIARRYVEKLRKAASMLVSINHESNPFRVRDLLGPEIAAGRCERQPAWMRRGYVEEVVRF